MTGMIATNWKLEIKVKKASIYNKVKCTEAFPVQRLKAFLQTDLGISYRGNARHHYLSDKYSTEKDHMTAYKERYDGKTMTFSTEYHMAAHGWGRLVPADNLSLSIMHRPTRHAFCKGQYIDLDMVNAQPTATFCICKQNGFHSLSLERYVTYPTECRAEIMFHHSCSKDVAKRLPLSIMFGGSYDSWIKDNEITLNKNRKIALFVEIETFMKDIVIEKVYIANPNIKKDALKQDPTKWDVDGVQNLPAMKRGVMGLWAQTIERMIQESCINFLVEKRIIKLEETVPCQDGFMIKPEAYYETICEDLNKHIINKYAIDVKWATKEFDEAVVLPEWDGKGGYDNYFVSSDNDAIEIMQERHTANFIYANKQMYFKHNNQWFSDKDMIKNLLATYILESKIYRTNKNNELVPYCQNMSTCKSVREGLLAKFAVYNRNDSLYKLFHSSTKDKLCFQDGILDFALKTFTLWDAVKENTIFTTVIIERKYAEYFKNPDQNFIHKIENDIINNIFGAKSELALQFFSRAIAGNNQDKHFMSYCGNRDCGKGILYTLYESAFGKYIVPFGLENMTCQRESNKSSDVAKEAAWLIPLQYARISIAQETDDNENGNISNKLKINNKVLKSVTGCDKYIARNLFENAFEFTIDATFAVFGNNALSITDTDSAQHHFMFQGVKQFVPKETYEGYLKIGAEFASAYAISDETLKDKVQTDDYANAMVHLLYSHYTHTTLKVPDVENEGGEVVLTLRQLIFEKYDITGNANDKVPKQDVFDNIKGDQKKIKAELTELKCIGDNSCKTTVTETDEHGTKTTKRVQAFKGMKLKVAVAKEEEESDEEEE